MRVNESKKYGCQVLQTHLCASRAAIFFVAFASSVDLAGALEVVDAEPSRIGTPGNWDGMQTKRFPIVPSSVDLANILEVADAGACPAVSLAFLESEDKHGGPLILVRKEKDGRHRL